MRFLHSNNVSTLLGNTADFSFANGKRKLPFQPFEVGAAQPRPQGLSSLPPLVVGRKTLVAAGHVTTQNLGGKKICWMRGVAECFVCCCDKLCGFQNLERSL